MLISGFGPKAIWLAGRIGDGYCGVEPDPERHLENIRQAAEAGYDEVYVQQIGPEQGALVRFYEKEVLPKMR